MKSFKLGLPSLLLEKKSPAVAQNASVKEEVADQVPTLPTKQMEVVLEKDTMEGVEVEMQVAGATTSCPNQVLSCLSQLIIILLHSCQTVSPFSPSPSLIIATPTTQLLPGILPTNLTASSWR